MFWAAFSWPYPWTAVSSTEKCCLLTRCCKYKFCSWFLPTWVYSQVLGLQHKPVSNVLYSACTIFTLKWDPIILSYASTSGIRTWNQTKISSREKEDGTAQPGYLTGHHSKHSFKHEIREAVIQKMSGSIPPMYKNEGKKSCTEKRARRHSISISSSSREKASGNTGTTFNMDQWPGQQHTIHSIRTHTEKEIKCQINGIVRSLLQCVTEEHDGICQCQREERGGPDSFTSSVCMFSTQAKWMHGI